MFATYAPTPGPCPTTAYYFKNEHFYRSVAGRKKKKTVYLPCGSDHFV